MTEDELKDLLRRRHWTISRSKTGKQKSLAAKRTVGKRMRITRYIGTTATLRDMTESDILTKLL